VKLTGEAQCSIDGMGELDVAWSDACLCCARWPRCCSIAFGLSSDCGMKVNRGVEFFRATCCIGRSRDGGVYEDEVIFLDNPMDGEGQRLGACMRDGMYDQVSLGNQKGNKNVQNLRCRCKGLCKLNILRGNGVLCCLQRPEFGGINFEPSSNCGQGVSCGDQPFGQCNQKLKYDEPNCKIGPRRRRLGMHCEEGHPVFGVRARDGAYLPVGLWVDAGQQA